MLCLSGVCQVKGEQYLNQLLSDSVLANYRISSRKKDIHTDSVRCYFESVLAMPSLFMITTGLGDCMVNQSAEKEAPTCHF
ncbi:MAG: hypothetical protein P1U61_02630 [Legionellaceae bacterium]|nr:hypothetical protein [Legionellaceae bacterium]